MKRPLHQSKVVHLDPPPTNLLHVRKPACAAPLVHRYDADPEPLGDLGRSQPEVLISAGQPALGVGAGEPPGPVPVAPPKQDARADHGEPTERSAEPNHAGAVSNRVATMALWKD